MFDEGSRVYELAGRLFPICRSITGNGVRETLRILSDYIEGASSDSCLQITEIASGTEVFDWRVPKEWRIRNAYIDGPNGERIVDMRENNLRIVGYSIPVDTTVSLEELLDHVYTQPNQPDWIPYVTSYYKERWGFCLTENEKNNLLPGDYHVVVDSELVEGFLTYGELVFPGENDEEILIATYICHPSMANNECSGPALAAELACYVANMPRRRYTYRFVFAPETIGSITYISRNLKRLKEKTLAAFNLSCVGDDRCYSMVFTPGEDTLADRVLRHALRTRDDVIEYSFLARGSDERQYNAPGVDVPMVCFCRSKFGEYPEYHTSADDMSLVSPEGFQGAYDVMVDVIRILEANQVYKTAVLCEPQLGKRGLYPTISQKGSYAGVLAMKNLIAYANGDRDFLEIAERIGVQVTELTDIARRLVDEGVLEAIT